ERPADAQDVGDPGDHDAGGRAPSGAREAAGGVARVRSVPAGGLRSSSDKEGSRQGGRPAGFSYSYGRASVGSSPAPFGAGWNPRESPRRAAHPQGPHHP